MSAPGSWDEFDWEAHWKGIVKGTYQPPAQPITWEYLYQEHQRRYRIMGPVEFSVSMANILDTLPTMTDGEIFREVNNGDHRRANTGEFSK